VKLKIEDYIVDLRTYAPKTQHGLKQLKKERKRDGRTSHPQNRKELKNDKSKN
jgi:hypothetical protein